jgi:hypothetical protein
MKDLIFTNSEMRKIHEYLDAIQGYAVMEDLKKVKQYCRELRAILNDNDRINGRVFESRSMNCYAPA